MLNSIDDMYAVNLETLTVDANVLFSMVIATSLARSSAFKASYIYQLCYEYQKHIRGLLKTCGTG